MAISPEALELARDAVDPERDRWWVRSAARWSGEPPSAQPTVLLLAEIIVRLDRIEALLAADAPNLDPEDELGLPT